MEHDISLWPERAPSPPQDAEIETKVDAILRRMSLQEKVGQMIQAELKHVTPEDVRTYHLGSVLNGGGTTPNNDKYATPADWAQLAERFYQASIDEADGGVGIPIIWGTDSVHGNNNIVGATLFPHNIGLGAANDPDLVYRIGVATAIETAVNGVDWTFAPTVAVARDVRWGRTFESYSEDPELVRAYTQRMINAIQGDAEAGSYVPGKLVATAKHFVGDGGTTDGIDRGNTKVSEQELRDVHSAGYFAALDSRVLTNMASFNSWNGVRLHAHRYLLTDVLKNRLGFDGFVVSDWNGHRHIPGCSVERCAAAVNAGIDMLMVTEAWREFYQNLIRDVEQGLVSIDRIDDAVRRILRVKFHAGLFDAGSVLSRGYVGDNNRLGHPDHRAVAREAVRKSLVLLKNNRDVLPIAADAQILLAGDGAHNIGKQSGGWSLSWQGTGNSNEDFPGATSIFEGFRAALEQGGGRAVLSESGVWNARDFPKAGKPEVAVVVYGEEPYAEWHGDIADLEYQSGKKTDLALLKSLVAQGIPVVSVFLSGRPLWVNKELNASDAFVAAWLPGSEGAGVADVLVEGSADNRFDFHGRLSFSWPKYVTQATLHRTQQGYDPLFPYGYGLRYSDDVMLPVLDERGTQTAEDTRDIWGFVSREVRPWRFVLQEAAAPSVFVESKAVQSGPSQSLRLQVEDKSLQEDARRAVWNGKRAAVLALEVADPVDLSRYQRHGAALQFEALTRSPATQAVVLSMDCGGRCDGEVDLAPRWKGDGGGKWLRYQVDLGCFGRSPEDFSAVTRLFALRSSGPFEVSLANIKLVATPEPPSSEVMEVDCAEQLQTETASS